METALTNKNEFKWIEQETEKIHLHLISELHRVENEVNDRFLALKNDFDLRQPKPPEVSIEKPANRHITESRIFVARNSILTDLFKISHFQTLRHVFASILIIFVIHEAIDEIIADGRPNLDFGLVFECFGKLHIALFIWLLMQLSTAIVVYLGFYLWTQHRCKSGVHLKLYDATWLVIYITYAILFLVYPSREVVRHQLPFASTIMVLLEQLRHLMKSHSFIRENGKKVFSTVESETTDQNSHCPDYSRYLYFLFAPTMIYRDQYPRNTTIQWSFVLQMFGEVLAAIFYAQYVVVRFCIPTFSTINPTEITFPIFVSVLFKSIMPGSFLFILAFYGFLHCWLNACAEMLRFADRMYYKDWWTSTSFAAYYRTWNVVVHDWLYAYVYQELLGRKNRAIPAICVVLLSALFHEYVMIIALGFFYPVMFVLFGVFGLAFLFFVPRSKRGMYNIIIWLCLFVGIGLQTCFYFMESYARKSCPENDSFWDKVIPRSLACRVSTASSRFPRIDL